MSGAITLSRFSNNTFPGEVRRVSENTGSGGPQDANIIVVITMFSHDASIYR